MPPVRWVIFDAVGTLIYPEPSVGRAYFQIGRSHGCELSEAEVTLRFRESFRRSENDDLAGTGGAEETNEQIEELRWRRIVAEVLPGVSDPEACFGELFAHFANPAAWRVFADVAETMQKLRRLDYRLALASNFDSRLHAVCRGLPALGGMEHCIVSAEIGYRKPSLKFFREVERITAADPDSLLMVGDDWENDIRGAQRAGWRALGVSRQAPSQPGEINDLRLLPALLSALR